MNIAALPDPTTLQTHLEQLRGYRGIVAAMEAQLEAWGIDPDTGEPYPAPGTMNCHPQVLADSDGYILSCPRHGDLLRAYSLASAYDWRERAVADGCEAVTGMAAR